LVYAIQIPVQIGDVVVYLGEYVVANIDGAVVIPASHAKQIISFCEEVMATENIVRGCHKRV
jgi:regulator of RNase E activity RraA